jgi:hypothetical protein
LSAVEPLAAVTHELCPLHADRKCRVDFATCPANATLADGGFDACTPEAGPPPGAARPEPEARALTFNYCHCVGTWWYAYPSGTTATGPANQTLLGCANPDGDPLGTWCAVDPQECGRFAGYVGLDPVNTVAFDYCTSLAPALQPRPAGACKRAPLPEWSQCGGKGNCTEWGCADEAWAGACCSGGLQCKKVDAYYWQCVKPGVSYANETTVASLSPDAGASSAAATGIGAATVAPFAVSNGTANVSALMDASSLQSMKPRAAGSTIYVALRIDYPFITLKNSVAKQAAFKSDVVSFLKTSAAAMAEQYVYSAGAQAAKGCGRGVFVGICVPLSEYKLCTIRVRGRLPLLVPTALAGLNVRDRPVALYY